MTMQEALNKANEGGYMKEWTLTLYPSGFVYVTPKEDETPSMPDKSLPDIMLDQEFWKALGKKLKSPSYVCASCGDPRGKTRDEPPLCWCDSWENNWHIVTGWHYLWSQFIDHLALGGTIEEYFANL